MILIEKIIILSVSESKTELFDLIKRFEISGDEI